MKKISFKKLLVSSKTFLKRKESPINPRRDWLLMLTVSVLLFLGGMVGGAKLYLDVERGTHGGQNVGLGANHEVVVHTGNTSPVDLARLQKIVDSIIMRGERFSELQRSAPSVIDPRI